MLRLACCYAVEDGLEVIAPVHDAIAIEAPVELIEEHVERLKAHMERASREVLDGVAQSKFKKYPGFGTKVTGHLLLTDHKDECWFRNLKVRVLE